MNKLINIQILNNTLLLTFENGGYIKVKNLDCFYYQIKNFDIEINYLKFCEIEQQNYRFLCANNGKAISINIIDSKFIPDDDDNWQEELHKNISNFLKNNFIINNVKENKKYEEAIMPFLYKSLIQNQNV